VRGKQRRLARLLGPDQRTVIVPIDHSTTLGPIPPLNRPEDLLRGLAEAGADAVITHRGAVQAGLFPDRGPALVIHLSAGTTLSSHPELKTLVGSVEQAIHLGADALSVHITLGTPEDRSALRELGTISDRCAEYGFPLLAMMYCEDEDRRVDTKRIAHAARVAADLGADIVKVPYSRDTVGFSRVVRGCFVPVVVAGGAATGEEDLGWVSDALAAGAAGVCLGRTVFHAPDPVRRLREVTSLVHGTRLDDEAPGRTA
jgi:class I fructose-bisphosphate aldolase